MKRNLRRADENDSRCLTMSCDDYVEMRMNEEMAVAGQYYYRSNRYYADKAFFARKHEAARRREQQKRKNK